MWPFKTHYHMNSHIGKHSICFSRKRVKDVYCIQG